MATTARSARVPTVGALLALALTVTIAPTASAHNALVSTDPSGGSTVATVPDTVVLSFDERCAVLGTQVVVLGPAGNVAPGAPRLVDNDVRQAVAPGSPPGSYTVNWRVTSADGHPVQGTFSFTATAKARGTAPSPGGTAGARPPSGASGRVTGGDGGPGGGSRTTSVAVGVAAVAVAGAVGAFRHRRRRRGV